MGEEKYIEHPPPDTSTTSIIPNHQDLNSNNQGQAEIKTLGSATNSGSNQKQEQRKSDNNEDKLQAKTRMEKERLRKKQCNSPSTEWNNYCKDKIDEKLRLLNSNPEQYFYELDQEKQDQWRDNENQHRRNNENQNTWTPAGGGNKLRQDGTFMLKTGGGYIDTKTGRFVPSN